MRKERLRSPWQGLSRCSVLLAGAWVAAGPLVTWAGQDNALRYTVVATLHQQASDPQVRATVAAFHGLLLDELRKVPGITVREREPADRTPLREGEYRLTIASLETSITSTGSISYRTSTGQGAYNGAIYSNALPVEFRIEQGDLSGERLLRGTSLMLAREGGPRPALCAQELQSDLNAGLCATTAEFAAMQAEMLRTQVFPMDPAMYGLLAGRIADGSLGERQRTRALHTLLSTTRRLAPGRAMEPDVAAAVLGLLQDWPSARSIVWSSVRGMPHPSLVDPLLQSLGDDVDADARQQALTTLVNDYASDPQVRAALQTLAGSDSSEFLRMLARYAVAGADAWRDYALQQLRKPGLQPREQVDPLVYASDRATESFRKDVLPVLARDSRILEAVLALAHEHRGDTSVERRGPIRRALYALTSQHSGPVLPGSLREQLQALYFEFSPGLRRPIGVPPEWTGLPQENVFERPAD